MLSDHERSTLREIEQCFEREDRRFARAMRDPRPLGIPRCAYDITILVSALLALTCIAAPGGAPGAGVASAVLGAVLVWVRGRHFPRRARG
jgi:hypothetical protein